MLCFDGSVHAGRGDRVASAAIVNPFLHLSDHIRDLQGIYPYSQNLEASVVIYNLRRANLGGHG
jgi:hypothetical protein